jgi:hypothetical protein
MIPECEKDEFFLFSMSTSNIYIISTDILSILSTDRVKSLEPDRNVTILNKFTLCGL